MKLLQNINIEGKVVFLRADLNVPLSTTGKVLDDTKIIRISKTIEYLLSQNAKIILASHLGNPKGTSHKLNSLSQILPNLREKYNTNINFCSNYKNINKHSLLEGEITLLENLRFHPEEEENNENWAQSLSALADIYVNDAFACCHRKHASIVAITKYLPSYAGLLLQEEIINLELGLNQATHPSIAILGGKKASSKLPILEQLLEKHDYILLGGGLANTFLLAMGYNLGKSFVDEESLPKLKKFISKKSLNKILLPSDFVVINKGSVSIAELNQIDQEDIIGDIGPQTILSWFDIIKQSKTLLWNGTLGICEDTRFYSGSDTIARMIAKLTKNKHLYSLAGGGELNALLSTNSLKAQFSYVSTAGGAFLEWLSGKKLPGLKALEQASKKDTI